MRDTARSLSHELGPLRRAVLRATRAEGNLPDLPDAQVELLRALAGAAPVSPGDLAAELRLARSTVSNLVKALTAAGLVDRRTDQRDGRGAMLSPSAPALDLLRRYDESSATVLADVITQFDDEEKTVLRRAVPLLRRLRHELERATGAQ